MKSFREKSNRIRRSILEKADQLCIYLQSPHRIDTNIDQKELSIKRIILREAHGITASIKNIENEVEQLCERQDTDDANLQEAECVIEGLMQQIEQMKQQITINRRTTVPNDKFDKVKKFDDSLQSILKQKSIHFKDSLLMRSMSVPLVLESFSLSSHTYELDNDSIHSNQAGHTTKSSYVGGEPPRKKQRLNTSN